MIRRDPAFTFTTVYTANHKIFYYPIRLLYIR